MTKFETAVRKYGKRSQTDLGLKDFQAAGIWGNIGGETGGLELLQEQKPIIAGSRGGYGWFQWTGPRRRKYEAWCRANNLNAASDEANYRYLVKETLTDEMSSLLSLRATKDVDEATKVFMEKNLRPGILHLEGRKSWARKALAIMQSQQVPLKEVSLLSLLAATIAASAHYATAHPLIIAGGAAACCLFLWMLYKAYKKVNPNV